MWLRCRQILVRKETYFVIAVLVQLCVAFWTLLLLRKSIIKQYAKFRIEKFNEQLRKESNRHARRILEEISNIDYHTPLCNRNQLPQNMCAMFQDVFHESSFQRYNLPTISSGIFGSCLQLVKRLFDRTKKRHFNVRKMSYKPSDLSASYVNLGDFIFSSDRQWIPTDCDNATKVAVLILTNSWDVLPWNYSFLWKIIASLQRLPAHFGIFVADDLSKVFNEQSPRYYEHYVISRMPGWDHVVSFKIRENSSQMECAAQNMNKVDETSISYINFTYNDVTTSSEVTASENYSIHRQLLFTKISMLSTGKDRGKKRPGQRKKTWLLKNLKLVTTINKGDVQVSKSKLIPSDEILNER